MSPVDLRILTASVFASAECRRVLYLFGGGGIVAYTMQYRMKEWIRKEAVVAVSGDTVETTKILDLYEDVNSHVSISESPNFAT